MKKEKTSILDFYEDNDVTEEEQEEIDAYMDEELENHIKAQEKKEKKLRKANQKILEKEIDTVDLEEYEIENDFEETKEKKPFNFKIVLNVILCILLIAVVLACIDILCVTKLNKGPFFAIPIHTYEDGGTKEYYGIGYKVIKYNQVQGRRDVEIGTWSLKYNVEPIYTDIIDLAIEFNNDEQGSYQKYYKQLLIVSGSLKEVDKKNHKIVMSYEDDGEKYSIDVVCNMETDQDNLSILEPKYEISAMGTMIGYDVKTKKTRPVIYLDNCFAEQ